MTLNGKLCRLLGVSLVILLTAPSLINGEEHHTRKRLGRRRGLLRGACGTEAPGSQVRLVDGGLSIRRVIYRTPESRTCEAESMDGPAVDPTRPADGSQSQEREPGKGRGPCGALSMPLQIKLMEAAYRNEKTGEETPATMAQSANNKKDGVSCETACSEKPAPGSLREGGGGGIDAYFCQILFEIVTTSPSEPLRVEMDVYHLLENGTIDGQEILEGALKFSFRITGFASELKLKLFVRIRSGGAGKINRTVVTKNKAVFGDNAVVIFSHTAMLDGVGKTVGVRWVIRPSDVEGLEVMLPLLFQDYLVYDAAVARAGDIVDPDIRVPGEDSDDDDDDSSLGTRLVPTCYSLWLLLTAVSLAYASGRQELSW